VIVTAFPVIVLATFARIVLAPVATHDPPDPTHAGRTNVPAPLPAKRSRLESATV
jgi:hypothetical protein